MLRKPHARTHARALSQPLSLSLCLRVCLSLSLSLSLSLVESVGFVKGKDRTRKGEKKKNPTVCSKESSCCPSISPSFTPPYSPPPPHQSLGDRAGEGVCVYYCSTCYKAVRVGGGGKVEDMCYERRRAEACVY